MPAGKAALFVATLAMGALARPPSVAGDSGLEGVMAKALDPTKREGT